MLALLDFDEFHDLLLDAARDLLMQINREYDDRQVYAFYLFHDALWGFMVPKVSIEGGLKPFPKLGYIIKEAISLALRTPFQAIFSNEMDRHPHHPGVAASIGRAYFERVNMWLLQAQYHRVTFTSKQTAQYHRTMTAICIDVLQALDKRGLFGEGAQREQTVVNLVMLKDPDRAWLQNGELLNPPGVYQRWIAEYEGN